MGTKRGETLVPIRKEDWKPSRERPYLAFRAFLAFLAFGFLAAFFVAAVFLAIDFFAADFLAFLAFRYSCDAGAEIPSRKSF